MFINHFTTINSISGCLGWQFSCCCCFGFFDVRFVFKFFILVRFDGVFVIQMENNQCLNVFALGERRLSVHWMKCIGQLLNSWIVNVPPVWRMQRQRWYFQQRSDLSNGKKRKRNHTNHFHMRSRVRKRHHRWLQWRRNAENKNCHLNSRKVTFMIR